jgi:predicted homoserine dehydrogenase-like protein
MILVDSALKAREREGRPVRVGMIGAGAMGRAIANQIVNAVPGMRLAAISNRHLDTACRAYGEAGLEDIAVVDSGKQLEQAIAAGRPAVTDDPSLLCQSGGLDAIIEVTGTVEFAAGVVLDAIGHGKHVVLMNAELDGTVGPILKTYADRAGVILTACEGDQPGVEMNLYRFVKGIGLTPLLCGNIKGLQDHYRTPTTQQGYAAKWGLKPEMATSFADGTKISFEQAIVANGTGMRVAQRGMLGYDVPSQQIDDLTRLYDVDWLQAMGGIVDYVVGARPAPGVFVFAAHGDAKQRHLLNLYRLGEGPLYSFYVPYHLCHFEVPTSVARAVLFNDAALAPLGGPLVEVIATAKTDLRRGQLLDGIGGYLTYGQCENANVTMEEGLLPMGVAEGCRLRRDIPKDGVIGYQDVDLPQGRLCDRLRAEQAAHFGALVAA